MSKSLGINSTKRIVSLMVGDIGVVITLDVKIVSSASIGISYLIPHESRISMIDSHMSLRISLSNLVVNINHSAIGARHYFKIISELQ